MPVNSPATDPGTAAKPPKDSMTLGLYFLTYRYAKIVDLIKRLIAQIEVEMFLRVNPFPFKGVN